MAATEFLQHLLHPLLPRRRTLGPPDPAEVIVALIGRGVARPCALLGGPQYRRTRDNFPGFSRAPGARTPMRNVVGAVSVMFPATSLMKTTLPTSATIFCCSEDSLFQVIMLIARGSNIYQVVVIRGEV